MKHGYTQLTSEERYALSTLRKQGVHQAAIARALGRSPSTISREIRRNSRPSDGHYRPFEADISARVRRSRSRRNQRFSKRDWDLVEAHLRLDWSPEQVSGRFKRDGTLRMSHETIYGHVWADKRRGGTLYTHLRCAAKKRRKRYGSRDRRGCLVGKKRIEERPPGALNRSRVGHLEGDLMHGTATEKPCILTLVDRKTGFVMIGKQNSRTAADTTRRMVALLRRAPRQTRTVTLDNGTEFHSYKQVEAKTDAEIYFAHPHHSWERGTSENTNGLIRQYLRKGQSMASLTQRRCDRIARRLNSRPRKRLDYRTPEECHIP